MKTTLAALPVSVALSALLLTSGMTQANDAKVHGGTLTCGGNHFSRISGTELHRTSYILRNYSRSATIMIERVLVFDANGNRLFGYPDNGLPASVKTVLGPHETTQINTGDILEGELDAADRPLQTHIKWSYDGNQKDIPLDGSTVRTVRADNGEERSRASSECRR